MIPEEVIGELRERTDIVAVIGEYVRLKKRGANHLGLCPFHNEKSPSFNVHAGRKFFHCFGCKASGDVLSFLMRVEGLSFPEAARNLAERSGVELPEADRQQDAAEARARERKEGLYAVMEAATAYYEQQRREHPRASLATDALAGRSISDATADAFRIGFAPPQWDGLLDHLKAKDLSLKDAEELGLIVPRRDASGHYDRFRNRLQFPVSDVSGRVVAFSGRILESDKPKDDDRPEPKYVNSPEGPLYHKGSLLFGMHQARVDMRRNGWGVLCEGNFDVLALHEAGVANAVAPLGTAFTSAQAKALARFASRATVMFDGDAAGMKAVGAAYPLLQQAQISARVVSLPKGEDPDSYLRAHGSDALKALIDGAPGIVEALIDAAAEGAGSGAAERAEAIQALGPVLKAVDNPVEIELYIERVARRFGIADQRAVRQQLRRGVLATRGRGTSRERANAPPPERRVEQPTPVKLPKLQAELVGLLLDVPELFCSEDGKKLAELLTSPELQCIFRSAAELVQKNGVLDGSALLSDVSEGGALSWLSERLAVETYGEKSEAEDVLRRGIPLLAKRNIERELPLLAQQISQARREGDEAKAVSLTRQRDELAQSASRLIRGLQR